MPKYDESGYVVFDHSPEDEAVAKFNGYCSRCYHSFWRREKIVKAGDRGFTHRDCLMALADRTPRKLNPQVENIIGSMDKGVLKKKAKKLILENQV